MKRMLATAVLVAFMPTANAQDKGKSEFSTNAEYRARWFYIKNPGLNENTLGHSSGAMGRFKLGAMYKASEKVSANVTLLHNATFGVDKNTQSAATADVGSSDTTDKSDNMLSVNEAYATWGMSDDLHFKVGRMNYQVGDGSLIGTNDWEAVPYAFEGLQVNWEQEWGKLQFVAYKVRNLVATGTHPATGSSASGDPEHNMYGINFDLKAMPEWLKSVNAHIFKDNSDAIVGDTGTKVASASTSGLDTMRYGVNAGVGFGAFDAKAWWEKQGGKIKMIDATGTKTEGDYAGDMMQIEAGFSLPNLMNTRFFALYHKDSGDNNTSAGDTSFKTYDSYYYEKHENAGLMDLFGWGNFTDIAVGWTGKPSDKCNVGVAYHKFSRTEAGDTAANYTAGENGGSLPTAGSPANTSDDLGSEIDVWAGHNYGNGLSTTAILGYFMPGDYFGNAANNDAAGKSQNDKQLYVLLEGKFTF